MKRRLVVCIGLAAAVLLAPQCFKAPAEAQESEPYRVVDAKFDGGGFFGAKLPKDWKLVSVTKGESNNEQDLWFQDDAGAVYMVRAATVEVGKDLSLSIYRTITRIGRK